MAINDLELDDKKKDTASTDKKSGFKSKLIIVIVGLLAVAGGAFFTLKPFKGESAEQKEEERMVFLHKFEAITVSIQNTYGTRHLSASVCVELSTQEGLDQLVKIEPKFIDLLHRILGSKELKQLDVVGQDALRGEIKRVFNAQNELNQGQVLDVYFTEFITN